MIVKKVKREQSDKPKVWQIGDLVDYIRNPRDTNAHEKVAHAGGRNFFSCTHSGQKGEMIALAQESVRSKNPVSHWIFSWRENEQPSRAQVDELVNIFLEQMGLTEHQTIYALHHNTDHFHVHIAVNRTHPYTLKVVQPHKGFDIEVAHKIVALVEHKQGWASTENTRYTVLENGELTRARREQKIQPRPEAQDFERATGEKSAQRIAQERGYEIIKNAESWQELHQKLAEKSLYFEKKGSGAIIFVGEIAVKASSVDRAFGLSKLCKKLGDFVPAPVPEIDTPPRTIAPEPISDVNLEEWRQYQAERATARQEKTDTGEQTPLQALKIQQREERRRVLPTLAKHGLHILNIARHFLMVKQREERGQLRKTSSPKKGQGKPSFETWLRSRGLHEQANRWRHRGRLETVQPPVQESRPSTPAPDCTETQQLEKYLAAVNADRVRVTCLRMEKDGSKKALILDKQDGMTKGFTPDELRAHLSQMRWLQSRRENIYYTPLSAGRHHILIDDMTWEGVNKFCADGFEPAVVLQSSPYNYQCILTISKLKSPHNREVGNRLTERLNKEYGDPKVSGYVHPHRAPGFANFKPQYESEKGIFPRASLHWAEKRECAKAFELSQVIEREYAVAEAKRQQVQPPRPVPIAPRPNNTTAAYLAHYENIRKHLTVEDFSRVDAMIAIRLRASGHSPQAVADTILQCAPTIRQYREKREGRDWPRYAERTAAYAFGVAGDIALAKNEKYFEHWRKIEGVEQEVRQEVRQEPPRMRMR